MLKKILESKTLRAIFSLALIYFAFRKIDIRHLLVELVMVPWWFVVAMVLFFALTTLLGGYRWCLLLFDKPKLKDVWIFTRSTYLGMFYGLFFPTSVAGDFLKWLPLLKHYPQLSKTKLAGSVLVDRLVGLSAFTLVALLALLVGKALHYQFPDILLWVFSAMAAGVVVFFTLVMTLDFEKIFGRYKFLKRLLDIVDLLKNENKKRLLTCFLISLLGEPIWMMPIWFYSLIFHAGIPLFEVYIFVPIISLILVLPISVAGFGARENLYLLFFSQLGYPAEKVLLISTFSGIMTILSSLIGGVFMLYPDSRIKKLSEVAKE